MDGFLSHNLNDLQFVKQFDHLVCRVNLMPSDAPKVGPRSILVVIIVIALAHHKKVNRQEVPRCIPNFEITVSVLVSKPVDDRSMNGTHEKHQRQKKP